MSDRELLELAAKSAGYSHYKYVENEYCDGRKVWGHYDSLLEVCINPLINDGDALRLAVKLGISPWQNSHYEACIAEPPRRFSFSSKEQWGNDPYAATRRAIVRAAAEIGRRCHE